MHSEISGWIDEKSSSGALNFSYADFSADLENSLGLITGVQG